jgi:hypothetical protein
MKENAMKSEDILTPEQLAERLQVTVNWVYEKSRSRGEHTSKPLPVLRCGRYLRFYWPDVCAWLRGGRKQQATISRMTHIFAAFPSNA